MDIDLVNTNLPDEIKISVRLIERKRCGLIWSRGGFCCNQGEFAVEVQLNMELNFEMSQEVHKRGEIQIE
jgi:hypothetical protein